jgi:outer membrane protein assembly factor BamB
MEWRNISGPAHMGNYVVVGDGKGYVHWLNMRDGHFAARASTGGEIRSAPVVRNGVVYVLSSSGTLSAYTLG